ncbi:hypothetical protein [Erythrobacter sp. THAF29]|uniref:hypothetical protein n=1 Tax=Erythrobacter sp. THAF29 TaxID=2587851 RepID=UPI0012696301|nr:hypothetical protein [Erythrobacter sp. THAF29]QFT78184.1 hypothetical protein FIU90_11600 [Erythrobacter sp. THAF29]
MKNILATAITVASFATLGATAPALADGHGDKMKKDWKAQSPVVVETNAKGQATKVRIGDEVYEVCMTKGQDDCIQPRAAGLKWGNRPLTYWPGKPASKMD